MVLATDSITRHINAKRMRVNKQIVMRLKHQLKSNRIQNQVCHRPSNTTYIDYVC